jgi:hypothetical protein
MILALHLPAQLWPLLELIVAIFQPAMVLLLCAGLVLASTHLFAMLGTQWGNRRVTGKALIFSLAIHGSLVCAVVALIPEYQPQSRASFTEEDNSVEISSDFVPEQTSFDSQSLKSEATELRPWEKIPTTLKVAPERTEVVAPELTPQELADLKAMAPESATDVPEPQMAPPQATADPETGALAKVDVDKDYNPAAFETPLDQVEISPPAEASRAAPAMIRSAPRNTVTFDSQLARLTPRQTEQPSADFNPGIDENLESALPQPDSPLLTTPIVEQLPQRQGPANFEMAKEEVLPNGGAGPSNPQMAAPNQKPVRAAPRPFPKPTGELAALSPAKPRQKQGTLPNELNEPVLPDELGIEEALPELMKPQGLSPVPLANSTPAQYQLRSPEQREQAVEQFGGSEQSEAAVDRALKWLASTQDIEGYWDADLHGAGKVAAQGGIDRQFAGKDADTGVTALAILAFLGKQNTLEEGEYSANVTKALRWLVYQQGKSPQGIDGYLGGRASEIAGTYSHAISTFAMAEAYAMTKDQEKSLFLVEPLQKAVRYILLCQLEDGGWRYKRGQEGGGDMSIFGWQLMALKSAQAAGLEIPLSTREKMINFLQRRALGTAGGLAGYRERERPSLAMTAESLFCKQMLGQPREHPACEEAVNYLLTNPPSRQNLNLYAWYYSTLALYQYGGEPWEKWNGRLRDLLISEQLTEGENAGSWEPRDQWGGYGGRIYSTAFATLTLEVYYRYLPLYRSTAPAAAPKAAEPTEK